MVDSNKQDSPTRVLENDETLVHDSDLDQTQASNIGAAPLANQAARQLYPGMQIKQRFVLEYKLGEGGMGAVFQAKDLRREEAGDPSPYVALKVISGLLQHNQKAIVALQRETKKSQTLAHPNIITVYDFDCDGDIYYMTMESLQGLTLDRYIAQGRGNRAEHIAIIEAVAGAIAYAHKRQIVHSDLKPDNIFITEQGEVKVLDFGIARAMAEADDGEQIGGLTPAYASIEMLEGQAPSPNDDVYALGLIAYELLAGEHPFGRVRADKLPDCSAKKLKGIKSFQWRAISRALKRRDADRLVDAGAFLVCFKGKGILLKKLGAVVTILSLALVLALLNSGPKPGPDVPFEKLPTNVQQEFIRLMTEGERAQQYGDLNGALFYFDKAYLLHPRNPEVMKQLLPLVDGIIKRTSQMGSTKAQQGVVVELLKYQSLSQNRELLGLHAELMQRAGE
ncbi:MAG: serine/threonine protein kinase [Cellvibrionaceae bacterium]|nr:serine/threonine protein kinase [Cellvibrionaceae bacterium]